MCSPEICAGAAGESRPMMTTQLPDAPAPPASDGTVEVERTERDWKLTCELVVPRDRDQVFAFFSNAENLEKLTPAILRFEILTPTPIAMRVGAIIDYRIRIRGFPVTWRTEITTWEPGRRFVDEQLRGPYAKWRHEHNFEDVEGGTLVRDVVHYRPPGGPMAPLVNWMFVERDVRKIFHYRIERLEELFGG